jgi:hypothetical protein
MCHNSRHFCSHCHLICANLLCFLISEFRSRPSFKVSKSTLRQNVASFSMGNSSRLLHYFGIWYWTFSSRDCLATISNIQYSGLVGRIMGNEIFKQGQHYEASLIKAPIIDQELCLAICNLDSLFVVSSIPCFIPKRL